MSDVEFPSEVLSLFGAPKEESGADYEEENLSEESTEESRGGYETEDDPEPRPKVDVDKVVRQRDAVIREKGQLARERRETQARIQKLEERLAAEGKAKETPKEQVVPDPKKDPIGYLEYKRKLEVDSLSSNITELKNKLQAMESQSKTSELVNYVKADESNFRTQQPDYDAAMKHLDNVVYDYFVEQGLDEVTAAEGLDMWRAELFENVLRLRLPIAKTFYEHAIHSGYKANGKRTKPDAIDSVKRGMEAGSLGTIGRTSSGNDNQRISIEQYRQLHQFDPIRLMIANDTNLFRQMVETGRCDLPTK